MTDFHTLQKNLDQAMQADRHRLRRQLHELQKQTPQAEATLAQWLERFQASVAKVEARRQSIPAIRYDDALPIAAKRDEIKKALQEHQVLVIAGETGSGKTTQLPKICLELGRGVHGLIGHTQPRRLAARSVATRVAEEIGIARDKALQYANNADGTRAAFAAVSDNLAGFRRGDRQHMAYAEEDREAQRKAGA